MKDWQQKIYFSLFANLTGFLPMFISLEFYTPWDFYTMTHNHDQRPRSRPIDQNQDHVYDHAQYMANMRVQNCEVMAVFHSCDVYFVRITRTLNQNMCCSVFFHHVSNFYLSTFAALPSFVHKFIHISFTRIMGNLVDWSISRLRKSWHFQPV